VTGAGATPRPRGAVLDESGWGRRFLVWQPRSLALWVYLALVVVGAVRMGADLAREETLHPAALGLSLALCTAIGALLWWCTASIDRYAGLPSAAVALACVWGVTGATWAMAIDANDALLSLSGKWFGPQWSADWGAGIAAPLDEELAKGCGILLLLTLGRGVIRTAYDGFVLGAFCGLGFQVYEDVNYAVHSAAEEFGSRELQHALVTVAQRTATSVASHTLYTAVFGAGLLWFLGTAAEPRRRPRGLACMVGVMVLHGLWDSSPAIAGPLAPLLLLLLTIVSVALALAVFRRAIPRERGYLREFMAVEVSRGALSGEELDALSGDGTARRRYRRAARGDERRRRRHRLVAAHELADELARSGGRETARVGYARAELARFGPTPHPADGRQPG
jgi:protease PrsW